jgi:hypothetical protein
LEISSYKIDPRMNEILPVLADNHDHVPDALRYALKGRGARPILWLIFTEGVPRFLLSPGLSSTRVTDRQNGSISLEIRRS